MTLSEDLEETSLGDIDDGGLGGGGVLAGLLGDKSPEGVNVDGGAEGVVSVEVEVAHTNLSEVSGVEFVKVDSVVVLTSSVTTSSGTLSVLANATVTGTDVSSLLAALAESGGLEGKGDG